MQSLPEGFGKFVVCHRVRRNGVIGMKIIGNGDFTDAGDREKSVRFAMSKSAIDAVTIGFKNADEIDEALRCMNSSLAMV